MCCFCTFDADLLHVHVKLRMVCAVKVVFEGEVLLASEVKRCPNIAYMAPDLTWLKFKRLELLYQGYRFVDRPNAGMHSASQSANNRCKGDQVAGQT